MFSKHWHYNKQNKIDMNRLKTEILYDMCTYTQKANEGEELNIEKSSEQPTEAKKENAWSFVTVWTLILHINSCCLFARCYHMSEDQLPFACTWPLKLDTRLSISFVVVGPVLCFVCRLDWENLMDATNIWIRSQNSVLSFTDSILFCRFCQFSLLKLSYPVWFLILLLL